MDYGALILTHTRLSNLSSSLQKWSLKEVIQDMDYRKVELWMPTWK